VVILKASMALPLLPLALLLPPRMPLLPPFLL
jgi:hypothetical protein